jgi:hypothetical protein
VRRALKILSDREVSPQLGLLKSTLLQLDSTFSERTYGAGSFRDFAQKLAAAGHVTVKEAGRNVLVELTEPGVSPVGDEPRPVQRHQAAPKRDGDDHGRGRDRHPREDGPAVPPAGEPRAADGVGEVRRLFQAAPNPPRWPMYIRQAKQFMRNVDGTFDERKFGFASLVDLLRASAREGLFRMERDRQGVIRLFPGNVMQPVAAGQGQVDTATTAAAGGTATWKPGDDVPEAREDSDIVEGAVVQELETPTVVDAEPEPASAASAETSDVRKGRGRSRKTAGSPRTPREPKAPRARKAGSSAKPRASRAKKSAVEG